MSDYPKVSGPSLTDDPALAAVVQSLRERHNDAIAAVLVYGSCLRNGNMYDGLLDLYLLCDDYRSAYSSFAAAAGNWLLPPNVFYAEAQVDDRTLRCKATLISLQDFRRGCTRGWFQSYIWGRFAQPSRILYSRSPQITENVEDCLLQASYTLLHRCLPSLPPSGSLTELWAQALALSYTTELRSERKDRPTQLISFAADFFESVTRYHADSLAFPFAVYDAADGPRYQSDISEQQRRMSRFSWRLRRLQGKSLSILRLIKALFTFEGGLDYIAWKLERHSGQEIVIPDKVRRRPLLHLWGFSWNLYRRGIFK
ncbi:MAG: hypothetical protein ABJ308_07750 [Halieaceae bacterium]